ncbi:zinc finger, C6HC-type containing protein [Tanacetum coccineum]
MVRNGADDPYIRPLNHYGDQIFHKYDDDDDDDDADDDDDDDQYFTPRSSMDPMDLENIYVPALMRRNDAGDPYIRPLVDYEDKIFPISDDQKYAEQLQLEEALEFSSTSSSSKLPIDSRQLPERYCDICTDTKTESEMFRNTNVCGHMFCFDCIREHVATFYCLFKDCSALLVDDGRQRVTSSECPNCNRLRKTGGGVLNAAFMLKKRRAVFIFLAGADIIFVMGVECSIIKHMNVHLQLESGNDYNKKKII